MIQKLQTGGAALPTHIAAPRQQAAAKTSSTDSGLISSDLLKELKGIPVDVDNLMGTIADLEYKQSLGIPVNAREVKAISSRINRVV
jgi:hypothetical protein